MVQVAGCKGNFNSISLLSAVQGKHLFLLHQED
jgi:hypothetical protein